MASRDNSQGFAFVYVDIKKLLKENVTHIREESPVLIKDTRAIQFPKDSGLEQIRKNINRLAGTYEKLQQMLKELNALNKRR